MPGEETQSVETPKEDQAVAQAAESEAVQEVRQESAQDKKKRNDAEYNWAETRRKMQELEKQNRDLAQEVGQLKRPVTQEVDELDKLSDDDIITKKQAKSLAQKMAREISSQVIKEREASLVDERLQAKFSDFAQVVTKENIDLLKQNEPELAWSLSHNPDPYAQGVAAYKLLKKLGIGEEVKNEEKEKALKNSQKPVSVNAVSKNSAIGNAHLFENGLTKELKSQLWKEMQDCRKRG